MLNLLLASLGTGLVFGAMDAGLNANPLARRLCAIYGPIARTEINAAAGFVIDLVCGLVIVRVFLRIAPVLPGSCPARPVSSKGWRRGWGPGFSGW